jgi:hypothetical protein
VLDSIPLEHYLEPGVWGDSWNVRDLVAHLTEWHQLFLGWFEAGQRGLIPAIPAAGFSCREIRPLNREIQRKYSASDPAEMRRQLGSSHRKVLALAEQLTQRQLLEPGHFAWTKKNALVTYLGPNMASHYRFATKALRRWLRQTGRSSKSEKKPAG